jgi:LysM repeat protein
VGPTSKYNAQRPREETWLLALIALIIGLALCFIGFEIVVGMEVSEAVTPAQAPRAVIVATLPAPAATESEPEAAPVPQPTASPTTTPPAPLLPTRLQAVATPTVVKIAPGIYRVQAGDTLLGIAYRAGLTLDDVLYANPKISNPNLLSLSQAVFIPEGGKAPVGQPQQIITPVVVEINGGRIVYPQLGSRGGYVPFGAMSISSVHTVGRKYYSAGSFEYLHGIYRVPFPLPYIQQSIVSLPPPVPAGTCPLTGRPLANGDILRRRPLNVRIDNAPAARPQSGLGSADIIFETLAEGGITRFTAVFLCNAADADIGPVRSARLIDLQLAPMFKAILVHVGASQPVLDMIWSSEIGEADFDPVFRGTFGFGRVTKRPAPHNVYSSIGSLWSVAGARGLVGPVDLQGLSFSDQPPAGGAPGTRVSVPYNSVASDVGYVFDGGLYTKLIGGVPHIDANSNQPLRFANVILLYAQATYTDALEDGIASRSLHFQVQGAGHAVLLRDGRAYEAVWRHEGRNILFHYTDPQGNHIPLKPGATMVNIVPLELGTSVE